MSVRTSATATSGAVSGSTSTTKTKPYVGVGVTYDLNKAIGFGLNYDTTKAEIVDSAHIKPHVKDGEEFVRVSTNVLTPEGKRGVGTQLARNKAYDAVSKGQEFCGDIDVLGTAYAACYRPVKDGGGKVIGASYIGHKK